MPDPRPAFQFGRYSVASSADGRPEELGRGAMGVTYRATDTLLGRTVVLKVLHDDARGSGSPARKRFLREAAAAAQLAHPHIAAVHDIGEQGGVDFYVMEFIEGLTLAQRIEAEGPFSERDVLAIARQTGNALAEAWRHQLIHRDLKPSNLMLARAPEVEAINLKVIDFGLAKSVSKDERAEASLTLKGDFIGSPAFASPEQLEGREIDTRADLYSLGVTLWNLLTGELPFSGTSFGQIVTGHLMRPPPLDRLRLHGVREPLVRLLAHLLQKDVDDRPGNPEEFLRVLDACETELAKLSAPALKPAPKPAPLAPPAEAAAVPPVEAQAPPVVIPAAPIPRSIPAAALIAAGIVVAGLVAFGVKVVLDRSGGSAVVTPTPKIAPSVLTPTPGAIMPTPLIAAATPTPVAPTAAPRVGPKTPEEELREADRMVASDPPGALVRYAAAAESGNGDAQAALGAAYFYGVMSQPDRPGPPTPGGKNFDAAERWLKRGVEAGNARATAILSAMYFNGLGVPKDIRRGLNLLREASELGNPSAKALLALRYGQGVPDLLPRDPQQAIRLMREAEADGYSQAISYFGYWHIVGYLVPKDETLGLTMIQRAADSGSVLAQFHLGLIYVHGRGVPKDEERGIRHWTAAARYGMEQAQEELKKLGRTW